MSYQEFHEAAWAKLPFWQRRLAVERLKAGLSPTSGFAPPTALADWSALISEHGLGEWLPLYFHFSDGMAVRNILRSNHAGPPELRRLPVILDEELPGMDYDGHEQHNWDDTYVQCIEAACGFRELEERAYPDQAVFDFEAGL
jgi:hypothetical protein